MKRVLIFLINVYRVGISPYLGPSCRYHPTCSKYAIDAIQIHGSLKGTWMAIRRILSCHPWSEGGYDPVPGTNTDQSPSTKTNS